jgi:hypothetical protein
MKAVKSAAQALIVAGLFAGLAFMAVGCSKPEAAPEAPAAVEQAPVAEPAPAEVPAEPEAM